LLGGGQACIVYGASEFSRDIDILILADPANLAALSAALARLEATVIAVPPFEPQYLARGHAVHFPCTAAGCAGIRLDVMARMRGVARFEELWERRTSVATANAGRLDLLAVPDLVQSKKTQRDKDWPMIKALVEVDFLTHQAEATEAQSQFWLMECRTPELLIELTKRYPTLTARLVASRPLLALARDANATALEDRLAAEEQAVRDADREYWQPLREELEVCAAAERNRTL